MTAFLALTVFGEAVAQNGENLAPDTGIEAQTEQKQDSSKTDSDLLLVPGQNPYWIYQYATDEPERFMQSGVFVDRYGVGAELTYRPTHSRIYGNLFLSGMTDPSRWIADADYIAFGGLTIGVETLLYATGPSRGYDVVRADLDGTQFYARVGPGLGFTVVGRPGTNEFHPGVLTQAAVGGLTKITRRWAFYMELSGNVGFFPTQDEMHWMGTPQISVGFLLFGQQVIQPYRF